VRLSVTGFSIVCHSFFWCTQEIVAHEDGAEMLAQIAWKIRIFLLLTVTYQNGFLFT
jgi:hypothetical protein